MHGINTDSSKDVDIIVVIVTVATAKSSLTDFWTLFQSNQSFTEWFYNLSLKMTFFPSDSYSYIQYCIVQH